MLVAVLREKMDVVGLVRCKCWAAAKLPQKETVLSCLVTSKATIPSNSALPHTHSHINSHGHVHGYSRTSTAATTHQRRTTSPQPPSCYTGSSSLAMRRQRGRKMSWLWALRTGPERAATAMATRPAELRHPSRCTNLPRRGGHQLGIDGKIWNQRGTQKLFFPHHPYEIWGTTGANVTRLQTQRQFTQRFLLPNALRVEYFACFRTPRLKNKLKSSPRPSE